MIFERTVRWARVVRAAGWLMLAFLAVSPTLVGSSSLGVVISVCILGAISLTLAWRVIRGPSLRVFDDHMEIRSEYRTRRVERVDIDTFEVRPARALVAPTMRLYVLMKDGASRMTEVASYRSPRGGPTFADRVCDEMNTWLGSGS